MKYLEELIKLRCFTFDDILALTKNSATASSMLQYYTKQNKIIKIRKGLYTLINPIDKEPIANKFLIGSKVTESAVISHHSAFEFYGYANQVSYNVIISSNTKFNEFVFNWDRFVRVPNNLDIGINKLSSGIKITDIERTILDSINDFEKIMGFEELIQCITLVPSVNEKKILEYLKIYNKCFLYQKVGFILEYFKEEFKLSDNFFEECLKNSGKSSRYLLNNSEGLTYEFNNKWHITYPYNINNILKGDKEINDL